MVTHRKAENHLFRNYALIPQIALTIVEAFGFEVASKQRMLKISYLTLPEDNKQRASMSGIVRNHSLAGQTEYRGCAIANEFQLLSVWILLQC
jgi:hypothetical protein